MANVRDLKKQILSIRSIAKITKAMELVSTAKLKKLSQKIKTSREYFAEIYTVFNEIIASVNWSDSIYQSSSDNFQAKKPLLIIINSNFGLCGGYNIAVHHKVKSLIKKETLIVAIGSKLNNFLKTNHWTAFKTYDVDQENFTYSNARIIMAEILALFNDHQCDEIKITYTKFINNVKFEPTIITLLPIKKIKVSEKKIHKNVLTEFDPSPENVLENSLPLYLNTVFYACIYESKLSEQASRRNAMQNASKNASEMIEKLSLKYNRIRQAAITQEIIEIISGSNAN